MKKKATKQKKNSTIDAAEVKQFEALATQWWDEDGPMRPLHRLNPVRLSYIREQICRRFDRDGDGLKPLKGIKIVDVGCGGGLVTEPLSRMGATVTGIDAGAENIKVAGAHAARQRLDIDYRAASAESLAAAGEKFDVVTALEIVEHVASPELFIKSCCKLVKKDGMLVLSTLNRTAKSFALGIVAAEYILRWIPAGTHNWKKFMRPSELSRILDENGAAVTDLRGLIYNPLSRSFSLSVADLDVNYLLTAVKN